MIFPMTYTCSNTLPYPYDVHSWAEYASYFVIIFKSVSEKNYDTRPIASHTIKLLWGNGWIPWFPGVILARGSNYMASAESSI
ncbi:hypothetical protein SFRURICE_006290 [Spodoptera frugiperda]|uniref:SFRICE_039259 n=1 Tax=Spodoptera frugiperda TaxID=7108 RepID=A0A2H1WVN5_SPOFR|nr:hypothetical protein SFRURICE_006290 [Spodoptera frugiperda]